jgi:hypothetical protein
VLLEGVDRNNVDLMMKSCVAVANIRESVV